MSKISDNKNEKKLLRNTKQYDEEKLVKIDGEGEKGEYIYSEYISYMQNKYNLTVEEACYYIGCSYTYFVTRLISKVYHIRINTAARKLINLYSKTWGDLEESLRGLVYKRILLNREDFFQYMRSSITIEQQYKVFTLNDFDYSILREIKNNLNIYNSKHGMEKSIETISNVFSGVVSHMSSKNEPVKYDPLEDYTMPEKFYSLKEIKARWRFNHDVEVYRMLDANGARKFILCNGDFVRYDIREFERDGNHIKRKPDDIIKIDYRSYQNLKSKYKDVAMEIQKQALKVSINLAEK